LGFGQRIGSLEVHGILGCENREPRGQRAACAVGGDLALFHALEKSSLRARRHAVDFVHQDRSVKTGPAWKVNVSEPGRRMVVAEKYLRA